MGAAFSSKYLCIILSVKSGLGHQANTAILEQVRILNQLDTNLGRPLCAQRSSHIGTLLGTVKDTYNHTARQRERKVVDY